ncbi:MAG: IS30 family transposase [Calditrichaeota bacterium]|nr:MAG: IS30 family transposase [Calditrichota bacterium]
MAAHLSIQERDRIAQLHHQGHEQKEIAEIIGRSPSTISRELRRNGTGQSYFAAQAHERAATRRRERPITRKMDNPELNEAVREGLAQGWSPEQIVGYLKRNPEGPSISGKSIYTWIGQDEYSEHWRSFLRRRGKRPSRRKKPTPPGAPIDGRPEVIEQRLRLGDFEGDTILGPPGTGGLVTLVDRKSRYTIIIKIQSKEADHVQRKIRDRLKELDPERRRSITFDNGTEFARCSRLEKHLQLELYYAKPGCPYQRGTNENTNGLIRQFFPKGTDFRDVSHHDVRQVENLLNTRPRQCLDWKTPAEVFFEDSTPDDCI